MLTIALAASLGTLAYLLLVGSSLYRAISSLGGGVILAMLATGIFLTTAAVVRRIRSGGAGKTGPFVAGVAVSYLASGISLLLLIGTVSSLLFSVLGDLEFSNAREKGRVAEAMRPWVLPVDSTIDAVEAGRAVARLIEVRPETWQSAEAASHWPDVARVARAPHVDLLAGQMALPLPDSIDLFDLPFLSATSLRRMGEANGVRVDDALRRGDGAGARRAAQELVSFGIRLYDASRNEAQVLLGLTMTAMGRDQLTRALRALKDPDAERIATLADSMRQEAAAVLPFQRTYVRGDPAEVRASILAAARAPSAPSQRWEMLRMLAVIPCTDTRTLAFGADAETRDAIAAIRAELATTPSDSAVVTLAEETPARRGRRIVEQEPALIERVVRVVSMTVGTPRLAGCVTGFVGL